MRGEGSEGGRGGVRGGEEERVGVFRYVLSMDTIIYCDTVTV